MVNELRGEAEIVLDGATFGMRPTYEAIVAVESATGASIATMAMAGANVRLPLGWVAIIVTEFVRAWGKANGNQTAANLAVDRVGGLIMDSGIVAAQLTVAKIMNAAVTGEYTASGEVKATGSQTIAPSTAA
jgi:hypothetical protein